MGESPTYDEVTARLKRLREGPFTAGANDSGYRQGGVHFDFGDAGSWTETTFTKAEPEPPIEATYVGAASVSLDDEIVDAEIVEEP